MLGALGAFAAIDLEKDLWFVADFDSPAQVNGRLIEQKQPAQGYVEGKFGRGYWFFPAINNRLPPTELFLAEPKAFDGQGITIKDGIVSFAGGTFRINDRPSSLGWFWCSNDGTGIWSFEAKGAAGTTLTLKPALTETPKGAAAAALANKDIKNYVPAKAQKDVLRTGEFTLTGDWQRVYASFALDRCTAGGRKVSLTVDSSGPIEMRHFQYQTLDGGSKEHPDPKPGMYVEGGVDSKGDPLKVDDVETLRTFPFEQGSCSFWLKLPPGFTTNDTVWTWGMRSTGTSFPWGLNNNSAQMANDRGNILLRNLEMPKDGEWNHVALVWRPGRVAYYLNGKCVNRKTINLSAKKKKKKGVEEKPLDLQSFLFGTSHTGSGRAMYDDFAILRRPLTDAEVVELANAKVGLASKGDAVRVAEPVFTVFPRSQKDAALKLEVWASKSTSATLAMSVDGVAEPQCAVSIPKGKSYLTVPFNACRLRAGEHAYALSVTGADGKKVAERTGKLTIQPRLEADPFIFMSWGGSGPISDKLIKTVGINCVNVDLPNLDAVRQVAANGSYVNLRYKNVGFAKSSGYDARPVGEKAVEDFSVAANLDHWRMTLVNTEVYGLGAAREAAKNQSYVDSLKKSLGHDPDFDFNEAPCQIRLNEGEEAPCGEIDRNAYPQINTIRLVQDSAHPLFGTNRGTADAIHSVKPGVCVWSEPLWGGVASSVDMGADWAYRLGSADTLLDLKKQYANCRRFNRPYMPTLSGSYWPVVMGTHPTRKTSDGSPCKVEMAQSADEVIAKTWMAIGAVPAHNLSFFALSAWQSGPDNTRKLLAKPVEKKKKTLSDADIDDLLSGDGGADLGPVNKPSVTKLPNENEETELGLVSEYDVGERYGAAWKRDIAPAAELLRDMTNAPARVAFLYLPESMCGGRFGWATAHYQAIQNGIAREAPDFDFIDADASVEKLASYRYLIMPMARVVFKDRAEKLRQVAERGTTIVQDSYATVHYPNEVLMTNAVYKLGKYREMSEMLMPWYRTCLPALNSTAGVISEGDGKTCHTFEKQYDGVRYIAVVNDLRVQTNTFINVFRSENYHVVGAPQTIKTTIRNVPEGGEVYLFNAHGRERKMVRNGTAVEVTGDFGPAEGCVYVVVPRPLAAPVLTQEGEALVVSLKDDQGNACAGRHLVELALKDEKGVARDESGRYVVENGTVRIPLILADADRADLASAKWTAQIRDLVSGLESESLAIAYGEATSSSPQE